MSSLLLVAFSRFPTQQIAAFLSYAASRAVLPRGGGGLGRGPAAGDASIPASCKVLDTAGSRGAQLIEIAADDLGKLRAAQPGLVIAPVVYYKRALAPRPGPRPPEEGARAAGSRRRVQTLRCAVTGKHGEAIRGAEVVAFTDYEGNIGESAFTSEKGEVSFRLGGKVERLYVYPRAGYWGLVRKSASANVALRLTAIDLAVPDVLRHFYPVPKGHEGPLPGEGVKVGVIDTGCDASHPHLRALKGANLVRGEEADAWRPARKEGDHGTHVAGIVASRAGWDERLQALPGLGGIAPGVELCIYRVFPDNGGDAINFDIIKAVDMAVRDGCDIINLSLSEDRSDEALRAAVEDARRAGVLVVAACGNESGPVDFPAAYSSCIAVSAFGRLGTFPNRTPDQDDVGIVSTKERQNFFASFSNYGQEVDLCAPGVAIISTVPRSRAKAGEVDVHAPYGVMGGTSMAAPAVTAVAARILASKPAILSMAREATRRDELAGLLLQSCVKLGFSADRQGAGMPRY